VVDFRAFGNRNFAIGCFLSFVTGIGIFATIYLTPLFLGYVRGYDAFQTGLAVFSTGVASMVGVPIYIFLAKRFDTRWLMIVRPGILRRRRCGALAPSPSQWGAAELFCRRYFAASGRSSPWHRASISALGACRPSG